MGPLTASLLTAAGGAVGTWLLRKAWRAKGDAWGNGGGAYRWGGWTVILASLVWPGFVIGPALGPFIALAAVSVGALAVVASGATVRAAKATRAGAGSESLAPEPLDRPTTRWRSILRWLLAGPIGMIAAMAVGIAYSTWVPGAPQTRLLIGALIVPVAWGAAMAWTLADNRIIRATAVLVGTALAGFGLSILKGFT